MAVHVPTGDRVRNQEERGRLEDLYVRHLPAAVRLGYLLTGDPHLAQDLAQEAFVRLAGRFRHLRDPGSFPAYLRRTLVNLHFSLLRKRRVERAYLERERRARPQERPEPDLAIREDLWADILGLPARQRAAIVLRYYEDLSERETADVMRCSVAAVKSLVSRGMETLREQMRGEEL